jgi:hypothetical protein
VLEALVNGLPALYSTCPALDGVQTERAVRVEGTVPALRAALTRQLNAEATERTPERAVRDRYAIQSVAAAVDDLYLTAAARSRRGSKALSAAAAAAANGGNRAGVPAEGTSGQPVTTGDRT